MRLFKSVLSKPTLRVYMDRLHAFAIRPPSDEAQMDFKPPDEQDESPVLQGVVSLNLPAARWVGRIHIIFHGDAEITEGSDAPEKFSTIHKDLFLQVSECLEAGDHLFNFTIIIPSSTATFQRCQFGNVNHYLAAFATLDNETNASKAVTVTSEPCPIFLHPAHTTTGLPPPLHHHRKYNDPELGTVVISLDSPHASVSALISLQVEFTGALASVTLLGVSCSIRQQFEVHHPDRHITLPPPVTHKLIPVLLDDKKSLVEVKSPICQLEAGEAFHHTQLLRFPDDDHIRPSTTSGSEACIKVTSRLSAVIRFKSPSSSAVQVIEFSKGIVIAPCSRMLELTMPMLPAYHEEEIVSETNLVSQVKKLHVCLCKRSVTEAAHDLGFDRYLEQQQQNEKALRLRINKTPRVPQRLPYCGAPRNK